MSNNRQLMLGIAGGQVAIIEEKYEDSCELYDTYIKFKSSPVVTNYNDVGKQLEPLEYTCIIPLDKIEYCQSEDEKLYSIDNTFPDIKSVIKYFFNKMFGKEL